jgi:hypothetical protein
VGDGVGYFVGEEVGGVGHVRRNFAVALQQLSKSLSLVEDLVSAVCSPRLSLDLAHITFLKVFMGAIWQASRPSAHIFWPPFIPAPRYMLDVSTPDEQNQLPISDVGLTVGASVGL